MLRIDIPLPTSTLCQDELSYKEAALRAGALSLIEFNILSGKKCSKDYQSTFDMAQAHLKGYIFNTVENVKKEKIALAVAQLQKCTKYEVMQVIVDGNKFTAIDDKNNEKVSGEFKLMETLIRFVFDDLEIIRSNYIEKQNNELNQLGFDDQWCLTTEDTSSEDHVNALMNLWVAKNPMPTPTNPDDADYAATKAIWVLRSDEACCFFSNTPTKYDWSDRYTYAIQQAIERKQEGQTALSSALAYVQKLIG